MIELQAFSVNDLAARWGVNIHAVYREIRAGRLKTFKIGRQIRITVDEVHRFEHNE